MTDQPNPDQIAWQVLLYHETTAYFLVDVADADLDYVPDERCTNLAAAAFNRAKHLLQNGNALSLGTEDRGVERFTWERAASPAAAQALAHVRELFITNPAAEPRHWLVVLENGASRSPLSARQVDTLVRTDHSDGARITSIRRLPGDHRYTPDQWGEIRELATE